MTSSLREQVRLRANGCCEYCGLHEAASLLSLHVEHIIPRQHQGETTSENLALACPNCNLHKGPNLTGIDPDSGELCRLFHPRTDHWVSHFRSESGHVIGLTDIGRTTVWVLAMNSDEQISLRQ